MKKNIMIALLIAVMITAMLPIISNAAATLYVGPGQTYSTIAAAYAAARAGDTILVKDGTYTEYAWGWGTLLLDKSNITIKAEHKWGAVLDAKFNKDAEYGLYFLGLYANNNTVDGFVIKNSLRGVRVEGANNRILNCEIVNNAAALGGQGIYTATDAYGTVISGNYIHHNGRPSKDPDSIYDHGLYLCGKNELVISNVIANQPAYGIQVAGYDTVSETKIYNNTIVNNGRSGIILWDGDGGFVKDVEIKNNIFDNNGINSESNGFGVDFYGKSSHITGTVIMNNLFNKNHTGTINQGYEGWEYYVYTSGYNLIKDPGFTKDSTPYSITGSSPAVNAGCRVTGVPTDLNGNNRPKGGAFDIGAYEVTVLENPGFEEGDRLWFTWRKMTSANDNGSLNSKVVEDEANAHTGKFSMQIGKGVGSRAEQYLYNTDWSGKTVTLSGWAKLTGSVPSGTAYIAIACRDASGKILGKTSVSFNANQYAEKTCKMVAPAGTEYVVVYAQNDSTEQFMYVDDLVLTKK